LRRFLWADPFDERALCAVGTIILDSGNEQKAFFFLDRATQVAPWSSRAWYHRGLFFIQTREWEKAVLDLDKAISLDPLFYDAYSQAVVAKSHLQDFSSAYEDAVQLVRLDPNRTDSFDLAVDMAMRAGQTETACQLLELQVKRFPGHVPAFKRRSSVCGPRGS
jgi:tetratricopeptide (TPR) repeat protein